MSSDDATARPSRAPLPKRHWTPRYLTDRVALALHERRRPDDPWLTARAVAFLDDWLRGDDRVVEWGSGRSTRWLSARTSEVLSVEHDPRWAETTRAANADRHVRLLAVEADDIDGYVGAFPDAGVVDLALIDGIHRDRCALRAIDLVRPGGLVVIDNVERYLPSTSRSPESIGDRHESDGWEEFARVTVDWRRHWTTNGVTDTALFFRP